METLTRDETRELAQRAIDSGADRPDLLGRLHPDELSELGATALRTLAKRCGLPGVWGANATAAALVSVLSGDSTPAEWSIDGASGRMERRQQAPSTPSTPSTPSSTAAPAVDPGAFGAFGAIITSAAQTAVSAAIAQHQQEIDARLEALGAVRPIIVNAPNGQQIKAPASAHKAMGAVLDIWAAGFRQCYLYGPAGSGKSSIARDMAKAIGAAEYDELSCVGVDETAFEGYNQPNVTTGETVWTPSRFAELYQTDGALFCLDELDKVPGAVAPMLNNALASAGRFAAPAARRTLFRGDRMFICATGNTDLNGGTSEYNSDRQDRAFADRFVGTALFVDYDLDLEARICTAFGASDELRAQILTIRDRIRAAINRQRLTAFYGTRSVEACAIWGAAGVDPKTAARRCVELWPESDKAIAEEAIGASV